MLQWSHVFSDMVRIMEREPNISCKEASMEPCLFRHGKEIRDGDAGKMVELQWSHVFSDMVRSSVFLRLGLRRGFNGAMSFQAW